MSVITQEGNEAISAEGNEDSGSSTTALALIDEREGRKEGSKEGRKEGRQGERGGKGRATNDSLQRETEGVLS